MKAKSVRSESSVNHADAIEKTARETRCYFTVEVSGIAFNPDDKCHREYLLEDGFVLCVPYNPVHKMFLGSDMDILVSVSLCSDGIVAMGTSTHSEAMFPFAMLALINYLNDNEHKFFAQKEKEVSE